MNKLRHLFVLFCLCALSSCITEDVYDASSEGTLRALWEVLDKNYCFFQEKKDTFGVDWDEVYTRYSAKVNAKMDNYQLFGVCADMLNELRDGHVNLSASHNVSYYGAWFDAYPANFSDSLQRIYLGKTGEYQITSGIQYKILSNNIGYMRVETFNTALGEGNLSQIMIALSACNGLIVDIRSNGGGMLTSAERLAALFVNEKTLVGYISHKTGPARNAFSTPQPIYVEPARGLRWQKNAVILTNRRSYSAANSFAAYMRYLPKVTLMGDRTGGGGGLPFSSELPNGWGIRFSSSPMFDAKGLSIENGIAPAHHVDISSADYDAGRDTMIEAAISLLTEQSRN